MGCKNMIYIAILLCKLTSMCLISNNMQRGCQLGPITAAITDFVTARPVSSLCNTACNINILRPNRQHKIGIKPGYPTVTITLLVLMLSGDIEINPGPRMNTVYLCGVCEAAVNWSHRAVICDECSIWYHKSCLSDISSRQYEE